MTSSYSIDNLFSDLIDCENCWLNQLSLPQHGLEDCGIKCSLNKEILGFKKGSSLIKSGDSVTGIYCIQKGFVRITIRGKGNKEFIVWIAGKGDVIGLNSFISDDVYSFSATAIDKASACFIHVEGLKLLVEKEPALIVHLMKRLCKKLNFVEQRITNFTGKSIRERCAEMLISIAVESGEGSDKFLCINYSIKDIANLIGTTRNYLYKILLEFTKKKILVVKNKTFVINDINKLLLIANTNNKFT